MLLFNIAANLCQAQVFKVSFPDSVLNRPFTGRVLVYLSRENKNPMTTVPGVNPSPCFSVMVNNVKPMETVILNDLATAYPVKLSELERGTYNVEVVWDRNLGGRTIAESAGNIFSITQKVNLGRDLKQVYTLTATETIKPKIFTETTYTKEIRVPSKLLSDFYHRETTVNAAVFLPKDYYLEPDKKFPVIYYMLDIGGEYHYFSGIKNPGKPIESSSCITVMLDGNCPQGYSEYANSDNNGPWDDALIKEFTPALEQKFRCNGARLILGTGIGGWSALWLQINHPAFFCGCWASSPEAVDFRSFRKLDLYANDNFFYGKDGSLNPAAIVGGRYPWYNMKTIIQMENVIYRGQQMHSYNAVFSGKGKDGKPESIYDDNTGEIKPSVASHWKNYDISLFLQNNWGRLKNDLDGKIRITTGRQENLMTNLPVVLLDTAMKRLNARIEFAYYPGDHYTVVTPEFTKDAFAFLERKYQEWRSANPGK